MPCTSEWLWFSAAIAASAVLDGLQEGLSAGTLTPAVIAEAVPELLAILASGTSLYECYQAAGDGESAAALKQKLDAMQHEIDQLKAASGQH